VHIKSESYYRETFDLGSFCMFSYCMRPFSPGPGTKNYQARDSRLSKKLPW